MEGGGKWRVLKDRLSFKGMACCGGGGLSRSNTLQRPSDMIERDNEEEEEEQHQQEEVIIELDQVMNSIENQACGDEIINPLTATPTGMNLASALAAERQLRAQVDINQSQLGGGHHHDESGDTPNHTTTTSSTTSSTPNSAVAIGIINGITSNNLDEGMAAKTSRVSLMALLEEGEKEEREMRCSRSSISNGDEMGGMCCVCMGRRKGAAFIPCGHTFCRVCSRELWLNRGSCPLCNRSILEILDIY
ncbi:hypothetical protein Syun_009860 [Stephania yunnanensis]|uniref:RING-type domain-containing protein n=1 Tax=Stephania yunnanensis TaxID=152371 RepID=A0AAP0KF99_9MAGN